MTWLLLLAGTVIAVEIFSRLPLADLLRDFLQLVSKISKTISSSFISDHWKEKVLIAYAQQLLSISALLLIYCLVPFAPFALFATIAEAFGIHVFHLAGSLRGVVASVIIATGYLFFRGRIVQ